MEKIKYHEKSFYFKIYTTAFTIFALFLCTWFYFMGKTFILQGDGLTQHYPALNYYAEYLRTIIYNLLFNHKLIIPNWDFSIGEGSDILQTLHYYVIGDPFSFFSIFIPSQYMYLYYEAMILLRLYLSGIFFSYLCFETEQHNYYGILAGSMTYVFCYWALYNITRHPFFLNPLLYMPLLLIGIEKILKKKRPYFFIISVFFSAVSNFYFFYMLVLITVIYVIVRVLFLYHHNLQLAILQILKIGIPAILGVFMAAVILLPISYTFLSDSRMSSDTLVHIFYPLSYYSSLPARFLTSNSGYWMCMGFAAPVLPAVFLLFYKKTEHRMIKTLFVISIIIAIFPIFGHVLNGFSYVTNRWSWAFALLCSYILTVMWPFLMELKKRETLFLILAVLGYFIICFMLEYSRKTSVFISIIFILFFLCILFPMEKETLLSYKKKQCITLLIVLVSILFNIFWIYTPEGDNYASEASDIWQVKEEYSSVDAAAIKQIAETEKTDGFWRYSGGNAMNENAGIKTGLSSTQFYWSLSNPYIAQLRKELDIIETNNFSYHGYDARTALTTLASVLYYVIPEGKNCPIPYGYTNINTIDVNDNRLQEKISSMKNELQTEVLTDAQMKLVENTYSKKYSVYRNDLPLPLAYTYNAVLSEETWNKLNSIEKQEAILQAVFLKNYPYLYEPNLNLTNQKIDYTITADSNGVSIQDHSFVVTKENSSITLEFDGLSNSETYVSICNLSFVGKPRYDLYFGDEKDDPLNLYEITLWKDLKYTDKAVMKKEKLFFTPILRTNLNATASTGANNSLHYYTEDYQYYNNRHNFIMNMGYSSDKITKVTISFSDIGTYSFDSIEIICQPMDNYVSQIMELRKNVLENVTIETDSVTGNITLDTPKILCFSIPYSIGWKAKVDGEEVPIYQANVMYLGIPLSAGEHNISLEYATPFLKEGFYISCISLFIFVIYIIISERKRRTH